MSNMKDLVKALNEVRETSDIKIVGLGKQRINEWDQETAVEKSHYEMNTDNYVLDINGGLFVFDVCKTLNESKYEAMEDEWVSVNTIEKHEKEYMLTPYYVMDRFDLIRRDLSESYVDDLLGGNDGVPPSIKAFAESLESAVVGSKYIPMEDRDYEEYLESRRIEHPDLFMDRRIEPVSIKADFVFDLQLDIDNLMDRVDVYDLEQVEPKHNESFPKSELLSKFEENGISLKDLRKLNDIANSSGNPEAFLNKFNKYSNSEMAEMFYMMDKGNKIVEIFSKDLDKYATKQEVKQRRDRSKKIR